MSENILVKNIDKYSRTLGIMDEFESIDNEGNKIYESLVLKDLFTIKHDDEMYSISLIIQRADYRKGYIRSSLTFTNLKKWLANCILFPEHKEHYEIVNEVYNGISDISKDENCECEVTFPVPVQFNAQNSGNRSGYGNYYNGRTLVSQGTLYGETTNYMFVGAKYKLDDNYRWWL